MLTPEEIEINRIIASEQELQERTEAQKKAQAMKDEIDIKNWEKRKEWLEAKGIFRKEYEKMTNIEKQSLRGFEDFLKERGFSSLSK